MHVIAMIESVKFDVRCTHTYNAILLFLPKSVLKFSVTSKIIQKFRLHDSDRNHK